MWLSSPVAVNKPNSTSYCQYGQRFFVKQYCQGTHLWSEWVQYKTSGPSSCPVTQFTFTDDGDSPQNCASDQ